MQFLTLFLASASLAASHRQPNVFTVTKYLPFEQHPCYAYFMLGGEGDLPAEACRPGACCIAVQDVNTNTGHGGKNVGPDGHPLTLTTHSPNGSSAQGISGGSVVTKNSLAGGSSKHITSGPVVAVLSSNDGLITKTLVETMTDDCTVAEDSIATAAVTVIETSRETVLTTTTIPKVVTYITTLPIVETSTSVVISTNTFKVDVAISALETLTAPVIVTSTEVITATNSTFISLVTPTCEEVVTSIGPVLTTVTGSKTLPTPMEVTSTKMIVLVASNSTAVIARSNSTTASFTTTTSKETVISAQPILANASTTSKEIVISVQPILANASTISKETVISVQPILANATTTSKETVISVQPILTNASTISKETVISVQPILTNASTTSKETVISVQPILTNASTTSKETVISVQPILTSTTTTSKKTVISVQPILTSTTTTSKKTVIRVQPILTNATTTEITTLATSISTAVIAASSSTTVSLTTTTKTIITPSVVVTTNSFTIVEPIKSLIPRPPTTTKSRVIPSSCPTPTCSAGIQYALYKNPFSRDRSPTYKSFSPAYFKKVKPVYSTTLQTAIYITDHKHRGRFNPLFKNAAAGYRGFLFACQDGRYRFNSPYSDDITIMWFGDKAHQNYTRDNADIIQFYYGKNRPVNIYRDLKAGTYYPIRVLWGNTGGASDLSLRIYGPSGEDVSGADKSGEHYLTTEACDGSYAPFPPWGKEI
ncbi:hypothetical protein MY11210_006138 [Beauveria gryllotalpidicola]